MVNNGETPGAIGEKGIDERALAASVVDIPGASAGLPATSALLWFVASVADDIPAWGTAPKARDAKLRDFIGKESLFASALGVIAARNSGFRWKLQGPSRTVAAAKDILDNAEQGRGFEHLVRKVTVDLSTQDNGAFIEIARYGDTPNAPLAGLNHLDAARCYHTGNPLKPVLYLDRNSKHHLLDWWNVVELSEIPTPIEGMYGFQYCALTRLLLAAQILRNIAIYKLEKTGGRHNRAIHILGGITKLEIEAAVEQYKVFADAQGLTRYTNPIMIGAADPKAQVSKETIELASLPDGFDEEQTFKEYRIQIAMAFQADYQDFAPLPGGNLGTSAQSQMLHMKARGKGAALFMGLVARAMNTYVLPRNVEFVYEEQDIEAEKEAAEIRKVRVETRKMQVELGEITPEESRQMALDAGDIPADVFEASGSVDVTEDVEIAAHERTDRKETAVAPSWIARPRWYDQ